MLFLLIPKSKIINSLRKLHFNKRYTIFQILADSDKSRVNFVLHIVTLHASLHFHHITKIEFPPPPLIPPFSFENSSMKIHQGVY